MEKSARALTFPRWKLNQIVLLIALLALGFGTVGVAATVLLGVIYSPVFLASWARRRSRIFWFLACQPLFLLLGIYLTWFAAWAILGHQPRIFLDDPKYIRGIECLVVVTTLWLLTCPFEFVPVYIMMVLRVVNSSRVETNWLARNYPLLVVPLIWGGTLAWLNWDPFRVFEWFVY